MDFFFLYKYIVIKYDIYWMPFMLFNFPYFYFVLIYGTNQLYFIIFNITYILSVRFKNLTTSKVNA